MNFKLKLSYDTIFSVAVAKKFPDNEVTEGNIIKFYQTLKNTMGKRK